MPVNVFVTEPMRTRVSCSMSVVFARSAQPTAPMYSPLLGAHGEDGAGALALVEGLHGLG